MTRPNGPLGFSVALILAYLIFPIIVVVGVSFNGTSSLSFPPHGLSLAWYETIFSSPDWVGALAVTFEVGLLNAVISLVLGVPAAFALTRYTLPGKKLLNGVILSALIAPPIIRAISTYLFFVPLGLNDSILGLAIAHSVGGLPFVIINVVASLRGFDRTLERAAIIHGAGPLRTVLTVTIPVILPGIIIGGIFAFMQSAQELVISIFVLSNTRMPLAVKLWEGVRVAVDPTIAAASTLLIALAVAGFALIGATRIWGGTNKAGA